MESTEASQAELRFTEVGPLLFVLAALVLISIGRAHDHLGFLAALRPGLMLTGLCVLIALVKPKALRFENLFAAWPSRAVLTLAGAALVSSFLGLSFRSSGSFLLEAMLPVMVFFVLTTASLRRTRDLTWITLSYVLATTIVVFASIFLSDPVYVDGRTRQGGAGMYDGNDIGVVYMVGLPLAVIFLRSRTRALQLLGALTIFGVFASLVLAASRGGFLGLIAGAIAIVILSPGWGASKKALILMAPTMAMWLLAPDGYWEQMATILNPQEDYNLTSDTGRMAIWTRGLGYVAEFPIFGVGPDNFVRAGWSISDAGRAGLWGATVRDQAPHNTFLQVWAELGTVGLLIWLTLLAYGICAPVRLRRRMPRGWLNGKRDDLRFLYLMSSYLPACFIGFAVTTFFVSHAYTAIFYFLCALLSGFLIIAKHQLWYYTHRQGQQSPLPRNRQASAFAFPREPFPPPHLG